MATIFQRSSQGSSVESNTIKVHDPADKILRESQATLASWSKRLNAEDARAERNEQYRQKKFQDEQNNRATNRQWEKTLSEQFIAAVKYNDDVKIKSLETAVRNPKQGVLNQLSELAPSIADTWQAIDEKREKYGKELGRALSFQYGITEQDYQDFNTIKGSIRDFEGKNIAVINKMLERGASWEEIRAVKGLSGYGRLGLKEGEAIRGGQAFKAHQMSVYGKQFDLGKGIGKYSLGTAVTSGNEKILAGVQARVRSEYLEKYKHLDKDLIITHMREPIILAEGRLLSHQAEQNIKSFQSDIKRDETQQIINAINIDGAAGYFAEIDLWAGENGEYMSSASNKAFGYLVSAVESGQITSEQVNQIKEHSLTPKGEKKEVRFDERYWRKADQLDAAVAKFEKGQRDEASAQLAGKELKQKIQTEGLKQQIIDNYENTDNREIMEMLKVAASTGNSSMIKMLQGMLKTSVTGINDTVNIPRLEKLVLSGMLTRAEVIDAQLTPNKTIEWLKKADENNPYKPSDEEDSAFEKEAKRAIENILMRYGQESKNIQSSNLAIVNAHESMRRYFKQGLLDSNGDRSKARDIAIQMFNQDIDAGKMYAIAEHRTVSGVKVYEPHFAQFQLDPKRISYPLSEYTTETVRQNPEIYKEKLIIPEQQVRQFVNDINRNNIKGFPALATHFVNKYQGLNPDGTVKLTELEFMKGQAELLGLEIPDEYFKISDTVMNRIDPKFRRYLGLGSMGVATALNYSGLSSPNTTPKQTGNTMFPNSTSIFREDSNLSSDVFELVGGM